MSITRDAAHGIYGALRLARMDKHGLDFMDDTPDGFWRSFFAAVIAAPAYVLILALAFSTLPIDAGFIRTVIVAAIAYVIYWTAFPVVMAPVLAMMDRQPRYIIYMVASNWAAVPMSAVDLVGAALNYGAGAGGLGSFLAFVLDIAIYAYAWAIARQALGVSGFAAMAPVAISFVLSLIITNVMLAMLF